MAKVTLAEAAQLYGVSERTLLRRIEAGQEKATKKTIDGREHWIVEVDSDMRRRDPVMTPDAAAVMVVKDAEIADLKQEIAFMTAQLRAKDDQIEDLNKRHKEEIDQLNERLHEANAIILQGQQKQIPGPRKWWQFWRR